ncbi:MAG: hypothetical protein KAX49_19875 [Halanaerobiales bacterium]|nr:hypothetical protein [Halanaerobiales bacterium]
MNLKMIGFYSYTDSSITRKFESMGEGLLLVRIDKKEKHPSPYHWFFENGRKPAFDISINPDNSLVNYIKFFFQDETIEENSFYTEIKDKKDFEPIFQVNKFDKNTFQIFQKNNILAFLHNINNIVMILDNHIATKEFNIGSDISILFDQEDCFSGVLVKNLRDFELAELKKAKIMKMRFSENLLTSKA